MNNKYRLQIATYIRRSLWASSALVGVAGLLAPIAVGFPDLAIKGSYISIPLILVSIVYLFISQMEEQTRVETTVLLRGSVSLYLFIWSCATIVVVFFTRSVLYYSLIATCFTVIIWQIFHHEESKPLWIAVLIETAALFLNIVYTVTLNYHFYVGGTDPLAHVYIIKVLLDAGEITNAFNVYKSFPLHHLLVGSLNLVGGSHLPSRKWNVLFVGLVGVLGLIFIFLAVRRIIKDWRYAATATALLATNSYYIYYMTRAIPRSVMTVFTVFILFVTLQSGRRWQLLTAFLIVALIMYHTVSVPFVVLIFGALLLSQLVFAHRRQATTTVQTIFFIGIGTVAYWVFNAEEIVLAVLSGFIGASVEAPGGGASFDSINILKQLWNNLQFVSTIFLAILGGLWSLREEELNWEATAVILTGTALISLTFPGSLGFIERLNALELRRWSEYTTPIVAIAASVGVVNLYDRLDSSQIRTFFLAVLFITGGLSVSNTLVTPENPTVEEPGHTPYLEKSEIDATQFAAQNSDGEVMADYVSYRYIQWSEYPDKPHIMEISATNDIKTGPQVDLVVIREQELRERGLIIYPLGNTSFIHKPRWRGGGVLELYPNVQINESKNHQQIYDNEKSVIYD